MANRIPRVPVREQEPQLRNKNFSEVCLGYTKEEAMEEAARCLLCHDAPCSKGCPAGTDPAKFIRSIRFRNVKGAAETIRENNILGGLPIGDGTILWCVTELVSKNELDRAAAIIKEVR